MYIGIEVRDWGLRIILIIIIISKIPRIVFIFMIENHFRVDARLDKVIRSQGFVRKSLVIRAHMNHICVIYFVCVYLIWFYVRNVCIFNSAFDSNTIVQFNDLIHNIKYYILFIIFYRCYFILDSFFLFNLYRQSYILIYIWWRRRSSITLIALMFSGAWERNKLIALFFFFKLKINFSYLKYGYNILV